MPNLKFLVTAAALALSGSSGRGAILTVTTTNNVSPGANETNLVTALNLARDGDTIQFNLPGAGPFYIRTPQAGYAFITANNLTIDGYSQPGSAPNTNSILAPNTARIQVVLDSRTGPGGFTPLGPLANPGYDDAESAILAVRGAKHFAVRGLSFLARPTVGSPPPDEPEIYAVALVDDATDARIGGCWFGLAPDGTTVAGGGSAVAAFKGVGGASASGLVFGTDGDGQNDRAEFNICMAQGIALNLETPNVKVAGNFFNVFPSGTRFLDLTTLTILDGGGIEAVENGAGDNMILGTEGDGKADADERNIIGPVYYTTCAEFWGDSTNITFAGNYVGVGVDGQTAVGKNSIQENLSLIDIRSRSSIRIGSNFDGVSDPLEANLIYNLGCQDPATCTPAARAFVDLDDSNNDNNGADAAAIAMRGNTLVNNVTAILMQDQNVTLATFYGTVLADSTGPTTTTLATNAAGTQLLVTFPPANTNTYPTAIVDFYVADPDAPTNYPQGRTWLGSAVDGSAQDLDPAPHRVAFDIGSLALTGPTRVTALVTYSSDAGPVTRAGRAVSAIFADPLRILPVAAALKITSVSWTGGSGTLSVSGGTAPYQIQVRTNLASGDWAELPGGTFTNSPFTFPAVSAGEAYYRVRGQ